MENEVKKMDSLLWDILFCEENFEWLAENVKGLDERVNEILSLIKQDEDMPMEKPEINSHLKEISHRHHLLADHYRKFTGELRTHIQSATKMQNNEGKNPSFQTPDKKPEMHNTDCQVNSSDISLSSSGAISDFNENFGSSSLASDSDCESCNSSPNQFPGPLSSGKMQKHEVADMEKMVLTDEIICGKILKYEEELKVSNQKLALADEEIAKLKGQLEKNEVDMVQMAGLETQLASATYKLMLHEANIEMENRKSLSLQGQIVDLESKLLSEEMRVSELQDSVEKYAADLSDRELEIQKLITELQDASGNFALEKWQLESCISKLSESLTFHEATTEELQTERESLNNQIKKLTSLKDEMEREQIALKISWEEDIESMKAQICEKNASANILNENLDGLKMKYEMLAAEKHEMNAKLQTLNADLTARSDQVQLLEHNLSDLSSRNEQLCGESESANKLTVELKSRIEELEEELGRQRILISEKDENKREAIRQLCFSIDHFRGAYEEIRNAYVVRKRPVAVVS